MNNHKLTWPDETANEAKIDVSCLQYYDELRQLPTKQYSMMHLWQGTNRHCEPNPCLMLSRAVILLLRANESRHEDLLFVVGECLCSWSFKALLYELRLLLVRQIGRLHSHVVRVAVL